MSGFEPERFEDKYAHYLTELQRAYKRAFEEMNDQYDSTLVHAIDQQVLNESEPFYEPDREGSPFRIELPPEPFDRVAGVPVRQEQFEEVLDIYVARLEESLEEEFLG